eukprot:PLAT1620.3.p1 GENE.PLAT1620.3~~PLAT1620.3.p1  ORF type:complete len:390 (-),score=76.50 PLAT1620.3:193-1362(-)
MDVKEELNEIVCSCLRGGTVLHGSAVLLPLPKVRRLLSVGDDLSLKAVLEERFHIGFDYFILPTSVDGAAEESKQPFKDESAWEAGVSCSLECVKALCAVLNSPATFNVRRFLIQREREVLAGERSCTCMDCRCDSAGSSAALGGGEAGMAAAGCHALGSGADGDSSGAPSRKRRRTDVTGTDVSAGREALPEGVGKGFHTAMWFVRSEMQLGFSRLERRLAEFNRMINSTAVAAAAAAATTLPSGMAFRGVPDGLVVGDDPACESLEQFLQSDRVIVRSNQKGEVYTTFTAFMTGWSQFAQASFPFSGWIGRNLAQPEKVRLKMLFERYNLSFRRLRRKYPRSSGVYVHTNFILGVDVLPVEEERLAVLHPVLDRAAPFTVEPAPVPL